MRSVVLLHDKKINGGDNTDTTLANFIQTAANNGFNLQFDNLTDFGKSKQLIASAHLVLVNSLFNCEYEFLLIDFLIETKKPFIKLEADYGCCVHRSAECFINKEINECCNRDRFNSYGALFKNCLLSAFYSAEQYQRHLALYGASIHNHFILNNFNAHNFWLKIDALLLSTALEPQWNKVLLYKSFGGLGDFLFALPAIHKIAAVSGKVSICAPAILIDLLKEQLPDFEILPETYIYENDLSVYDKIIDLGNYPTITNEFQTGKMGFPSYLRFKQHVIKHYLDAATTLHHKIDNTLSKYPYFKRTASSETYFTVHTGAGFKAKNWPADKYALLIRLLLSTFNELNCKLILGDNDPEPANLVNLSRGRVTIVKGNLQTVAGEISGALFHIGNDSGITHLAGAFNIPTVSIHGPTGPGTWCTFAEKSEVIWGKHGVCDIACNYNISTNCTHRICLNSISPQKVLRSVLKLLQRILPKQEPYRYILNPEATIQHFDNSLIIEAGSKQLLLEFTNDLKKDSFKKFLKNNEPDFEYDETTRQILEVLVHSGLMFKIPAFLKNVLKDTAKKEMDITLVTHVLKNDSIGRHGILFAEMLSDAFNINGIATRRPSPQEIDGDIYHTLTHAEEVGKLALFTDVLWHSKHFKPYTRLPQNASVKVCYSMFESSALPAEWVDIINSKFDLVLVPDKWLVEVYKTAGVVKPVDVLPLACELAPFLKRPIKKAASETLTFGTSCTALSRKNILGVINAFQVAFPPENKDVKLKIHGRSADPAEESKIILAIKHDPRIEFSIATISGEAYLNFMASLDVYITLSMGEGFSVTPREAMALGLPIILSDNTAHTLICQSGLVMPVKTIREVPAYYEIFGKNIGNFYVPDAMQAADLMKYCYRNKSVLYNDANKRRDWAAKYDLSRLKDLYTSTFRELLNNN